MSDEDKRLMREFVGDIKRYISEEDWESAWIMAGDLKKQLRRLKDRNKRRQRR